MKHLKIFQMACFGVALACCASLAACGDDDDDGGGQNNGTETTDGSGSSSGGGSDESAELTFAGHQFTGTWVDASEYNQWNRYMEWNDITNASKLFQKGLILSSDNTGAWTSGRKNNSFTSWQYRTEFTWQLLSWTWNERPNSGNGKILMTIERNGIGNGTIYDIFYMEETSIGTSQLYITDNEGYVLNNIFYTRME